MGNREEWENGRIKECPLCGEKSKLEHNAEARGKSAPGEILIYWKVRCYKCKCTRETLCNFSYYNVDDKGQLVCEDKEDARHAVIKDWNNRVGDHS